MEVRLGGKWIDVERARLGTYLKLASTLKVFDDAPGYAEIAEAIRDYFGVLGLDLTNATGLEILTAYYQLRRLNQWTFQPPFMRQPEPEHEKPLPWDYEGRSEIYWVHKLAWAYGWTKEAILSLWPEEAACYLQEILVTEIHEAEERYSLSELAYRYDKASNSSHYVEYSKPAWMITTPDKPKSVRMLRSMLPQGPVMDLETGQTIYYN